MITTSIPSSTDKFFNGTTTITTTTTTTTTTTITTSNNHTPDTNVVFLAFLNVALSIFPVTLHFTGIWLFCHTASSRLNEKLYLVNMSAVEISYCVIQAVIGVMNAYIPTSNARRYTSVVSHAVGFSWSHILVMLTLDRFLKVFLNIKYHVYVHQRTTRIIIFFCYCVGILNVAVLLAAPCDVTHKLRILKVYMYPIYCGVIVLTFGVTYVYIYSKIRRRRHQERQLSRTLKRIRPENSNKPPHGQQQKQMTSKLRRKTTFVPFWIMLTFILFIIIPTGVEVVLVDLAGLKSIKGITYQVVSLFWLLDFTIDGLIYILAHNLIKRKLMRMIGVGGGKEFSHTQSAIATTSVTRTTRLSSLVGRSAVTDSRSTRDSFSFRRISLVKSSVEGSKLTTSCALGRSILASSLVTVPDLPVTKPSQGNCAFSGSSQQVDALILEELSG